MHYSNFGEILKNLRKKRGMTQQELGNHVGLSKAVVSKYENGMGYPSFDVLVRIAAFFGVTTDYLLGASRGKTVDVTGLTDSQIDIIHHLIAEFQSCNKK